MKTMKNTMKCLVAVFMMAMAFAVTGITAQAAVATFAPQTWSNADKEPMVTSGKYTIPANGSIVIPVKIPNKGGLVYAHAYGESDRYVFADMYTDSTCTKEVDYMNMPSNTEVVSGKCTFPKAGTYYLKVYTSNDAPVQYAISGYFVNGANKNLSFGKSTVVYQNDYNKWVYHKIKAKQTGSLQVTVADSQGYSVSVKVTNKKKKDLTDYEYTKAGTLHFAVQKGQTYYIATKGSGDAIYGLKAKNSKIKEKSGSKQSKAVKIARKKTVKGVHVANKKSGTDWYKFVQPSRRSFKLTVSGGATNSWIYSKTSYGSDIKIEIIPANKRQILYGAYTYVVSGNKTYLEADKLSAGTYYIKVTKLNKKASGWYTLKWQ